MTGNLKTEVYNIDCLHLMESMTEDSVELIITSPPYYNAKDYSQWPTYQEYLDFMGNFFCSAFKVLKPGRMLCVVSSSILVPRTNRMARSQRFNIPADLNSLAKKFWFVEEIIWEKPQGAGAGRGRRFNADRHPLQWKTNPNTERITIYQKPFNKLNDYIIRTYPKTEVQLRISHSEIWKINPKATKDHPAPFPAEIPNRLIQLYSWPGDTIFDPFGGSGTTAIECQKLKRSCIISEKDSGYFATIKRNLKLRDCQIFLEI